MTKDAVCGLTCPLGEAHKRFREEPRSGRELLYIVAPSTLCVIRSVNMVCVLWLAHTKPLAIRSWFWPSSSECPSESVLGEQVLRYLFRLCLAALLPQLSDGFKKKLLTCRLASIYVYGKERSDAFPSFLHPKGKLEAFLVLHWSLNLSLLVHLFVTFLCLCV